MIALLTLGGYKSRNSYLCGFLEPLVIFSLFLGPNNHLSQGEASVRGYKYLPNGLTGGKCEVLCCTVLYCVVLCCTVLYWSANCSAVNMSTHCPLVKWSLAHLFHSCQHGVVNSVTQFEICSSFSESRCGMWLSSAAPEQPTLHGFTLHILLYTP
jgi:hypothetical protein